jgi:hypothetical protein
MKPLDEVVAFALSVGLDVFDGEERAPPDVERARATCEQLLAEPIGLPDETIWQLLVASAALAAEDGAAFLVHELADGAASAECPKCNRSSRLENNGEQIWLESEDAGPGDAGTRDPSMSLPAELARLAARARKAGRSRIASAFELLDSRVQCPHCDQWSPALETIDALSD